MIGGDFMKYTNMFSKLSYIGTKIIYIILMLIVVALFGAMVGISFYLNAIFFDVILLPIMVVFLGTSLNYLIALFCGDELINTGWVHGGNTVFDIKRTPEYYKRKKFLDFIQFFLYVLCFIKFIFNFNSEELVWWIAGVIICLVFGALYFMAGLSSIEKSKLKKI